MEQHKNRLQYGTLYKLNYYKTVKDKGRNYYEVYSLPRSDKAPEDYKELSFVCLRPDGVYESVSTVGIMCKRASKKLEGLEGFHFHQLRHTFTTNLISNGAAIKDVQEQVWAPGQEQMPAEELEKRECRRKRRIYRKDLLAATGTEHKNTSFLFL